MAKIKILVVDDEEDLLELVRYNLDKEGYSVKCAVSGEEALLEVKRNLTDLIVLDLMLPGMDGFEVLKKLRGDLKTAHLPVVILSAKGEDTDIVVGLELGADDYVTKPVSPKVLIARIKNVIRRRSNPESPDRSVISIKGIVIDPVKHQVTLKGKILELTATEFAVLYQLARKPGWVFTRGHIIDAVKGENYAVTERSIDVQIAGLRKKLGAAGNLIETVHGVGYRFQE